MTKFYSISDARWFTTPAGEKLIKLPGQSKWIPRISVSELVYVSADKEALKKKKSVQEGTKVHKEIENGELDLSGSIDFRIEAKEVLAWHVTREGRAVVGIIDAVGINTEGQWVVADWKNVSWLRPVTHASMGSYRKQVAVCAFLFEQTYQKDVFEGQVIQIMERKIVDVHKIGRRGLHQNLIVTLPEVAH